MTIRKALTIFLFLFYWQSLAIEQRNVLGLVQSSLDSINDPFRVKCGQQTIQEASCPYMARQFEHDSKAGLFFWMLSDSPWESCKKTVPSIDEISTIEFENDLAGNTQRDLGLRSNYFSNKFSGCFDREHKTSEQVENQKKVAISMSYNYLKKIGDNTEKLSREVVEINSIIGRDLEFELPCDEYSLPKNSYLCKAIKDRKCSPQRGLSDLSSHLYEDAIAPIVAISKRIKEVRKTFRGRGGSALGAKKTRELKAAIEFIKAEYPLLQGDKTAELIKGIVKGEDVSRNKFKKVLKDQLINNKRILRSKIKNHISMSNCILYGDSGNCDDFEKNYRSIPYQSSPYSFNRRVSNSTPKDRVKQFAREELYQVPECLDRGRDLKNDFNSFATKTSLNLGLTLITGGASLAVRAGQLGRIALTARAAALGADSAFLYSSIDESMDICDEELNKLEVLKDNKSKFSCPENNISDGPNYIRKRNMKACVTASLLSSLDALPFLPAFGGTVSRAFHGPIDPGPTFKATREESEILQSKLFRRCINSSSSKACQRLSSEKSNIISDMHKKCLNPKVLTTNKDMCVALESFVNNHGVYKLSNMISPSERGKSVVVEFNAGRGHISLRYFKEVEEDGQKVMKAFSYDGSSWLLPRRVNGRTYSSNKKADSFSELDEYVPGSHYVLDISPSQLETVHEVAKRGGFSKACTHDARVALDEAGILSMPKGVSKTFDKITIKQLAKDLTDKYGPPKHSTIKALEGGIDPSKAGFSKEQWNTFAVTELGWLVLTPTIVGGVYPAAGGVAYLNTIVIVDKLGETIVLTKKKYKELINELKK